MSSKIREFCVILLLVAIVIELGYLISTTGKLNDGITKLNYQLVTDTIPPWPKVSAVGTLTGEVPMTMPEFTTHQQLDYLACGLMTFLEMYDAQQRNITTEKK